MDAAIYGLIVADVIAQPIDLRGKLPERGGLSLLNSLTLTTGGNVCNVSIAMTRLGMTAAAAGLVGKDTFGSSVIGLLRAAGVETSCISADPRAQTSATVVAVDPSGERSFFHAPGVNALLDPKSFRRCFETFRQCTWLHIGYFGLLPNDFVRALPELLADFRAESPGTRIALDTAHPPAERALLDPILPHLDVFAPSRPEANALTGESDPRRIVSSFRQRMQKGLIGIKLDDEGCYLDDGNGAMHIEACRITPLDTTGAGDVWYAGLLTALRRNMTLEQCGKFANRAAADCCLALGASAGVRSFAETLARM